MILFLDTADLTEIQRYASVIDGVTTTPTIIKRAGLSSEEFITRIRTDFPRLQIHIEALGNDAREIEAVVDDFRQRAWYNNDKIAFKVPVGKEGIAATRAIKLKDPSVRINLHMVFSASQAVLAMHANADFIAPLIGRYADKVASLSSHGMREKTMMPDMT